MKSQQGSLLLEALITLAILSIGLLGIGMLQARSLNVGTGSYYRSIASDIASDLADRINSNRSPFIADSDSTGVISPPEYVMTCTGTNTDTPSCGAGTSQAQKDMIAFHQAVRQLPGATGSIAKSNNSYTITITWVDSKRANTSTNTNNNSFTTQFAAPV
ncbi:type IV pilus modification protein PilV [Chitinimonas arctica]|uniref:Type IV pilus modification protein PilV n=1 Tax=Chitinimonas arctica TaxID=2594795 RepID=A0A516SEX6_9NEIS|nr:type IV pilus modification protein PilV [Chitinimonas arctica]QDQ26588.1 type IV pilus modification protein PilV [Chitinimonas arctica]